MFQKVNIKTEYRVKQPAPSFNIIRVLQEEASVEVASAALANFLTLKKTKLSRSNEGESAAINMTGDEERLSSEMRKLPVTTRR